MSNKKIWFITGASKGLGLALVKKLIDNGYKVAATSRNLGALTSAVGPKSGSFLPLEVDLVNDNDVKNAIAETVDHFGAVDVAVNNAGYGQLGALEEVSDSEARADFDVNVFGTLNVIRHVMPYFRNQRSGHILNIASVGGYLGTFPGWAIYCSTKFAVAGLTEGLAEEIRDFGVKATVVYPGYFRTEFLSKGSIRTPENPIAGAYSKARESELAHLNTINGQQMNDPDKAASAMISITETENPPVHFLLGSDAYDMLYKKVDLMTREVELWKELTLGTGF